MKSRAKDGCVPQHKTSSIFVSKKKVFFNVFLNDVKLLQPCGLLVFPSPNWPLLLIHFETFFFPQVFFKEKKLLSDLILANVAMVS
jgi:hypothetical protein